MPCKECGSLSVTVDRSRPSERVYPGYPHIPKDSLGTWLYPPLEVDLCSYHRRKAQGLFNTDAEYWKSQCEDPCVYGRLENLLKRGYH